MEKLKGRHNHTLTNILKVFTFALVLLFPFLVFMPTAFYYGFNEHAQIEVPQKINTYQTNEVNNGNDLIEGNVYKFQYTYEEDYYTLGDENVINILDYNLLNLISKQNNQPNYNTFSVPTLNNIDNLAIELINQNGANTIDFYTDTTEDSDGLIAQVPYTINTPTKIQFYFKLVSLNNIESININNIFASDYLGETITETTTISENISNSWQNMWQTPLFKWTENTPFTATTNAFASVFNISHQSGFYNLVEYFITITAIYLVIDIVIGVATMLTHMIAKQD